MAEGAAPGSSLPGGLLCGLGGEPVHLGRVPQVAKAMSGFTEDVGNVDEPCPFWLVLGDDMLEGPLGCGHRLGGRHSFAEGG